ncbi:MAG: GIY-YIG nuclease family protein [Gammaproteobacteria bacterium]|nr:GIY-YIG nuclease family protein [Gammaproteobacteria bacterium]
MYVYLIRSTKYPSRKYIGSTSNLDERIKAHNSGKCEHTLQYLPWKLITATWFEDPLKASEFELFLKHGSGHTFAKKHFW